MNSALKFVLYCFLFFTAACKKSSSKEQEITKEPPIDEHSGKELIPVKFESDHLVISLKYRENTTELIEISGSDGYATTITYKNQQPHIFIKSKSNKQFETVDYVWDKQGVPKARSFDDNGTVNIHKGSYVLTYDQNYLNKISYYTSNGALFRETVLQYTSGNLSNKTILDLPAQQQNISFSYDTKNGIFKHLKYAERLLPESRYSFLADGQHNRLSSSNTKNTQENTTCNYKYNSEDYPSELSLTTGNVKQTFKITYAELKH